MDALTARQTEHEWPALAAIAAVFAAAWWLVLPRANVPVIDDWVYAWSVEHLVETGRLRVLEISAVYPIAQILWGALFARIAGFSFVVLRASTMTLSALGCGAVYLTLRELGCRRSTAFLGALALAFDPVYFALSFSFMTDVPFVSVSAMAVYSYVRAIRRRQPAAAWIGCACATAAFLMRPIGIVLPLALVPDLVAQRDAATRFRRAAPIAAALAVMGALQLALPRMLGPLDWAAVRQEYLRWWFTVPIASYLRWTVEVVFVSVFPLAPLLVAYATAGRRRALEVAAAAIALAILCRALFGHLLMPLIDGQTWSLHDIAARMMFDGAVVSSEWARRIAPLVTAVGLVAVGALFIIVARAARLRAPQGTGWLVIAAVAALHLLCINVLWLYNDRYYVVVAPLFAIVGASALDDNPRGRWIASLLLIVWAAVAVSGTRDMLAVNDAAAAAERELEASGIPSWDIDAGYALNGWRLYAHPEHLPAGADRRYTVPFVTSNHPTHYSITNSPLPGSEVLRVVPLERATWQSTRVLYVVRRP